MRNIAKLTGAEFDEELSELGAQLAISLIDQTSWRHRIVDSWALLSGEKARRRISLDCTPPEVILLRPETPTNPNRQTLHLLPLALLAKRNVRALDVTDDSGRSIPVLTREENGLFAAAAVGALITAIAKGKSPESEEDLFPPELWNSVQKLTLGAPDQCLEIYESEIAPLELDQLVDNLIKDLIENFLLIAVVRGEDVGCRAVYKYSYHWEASSDTAPLTLQARIDHIAASFGLRSFRTNVETLSLASAASYHFECEAPTSLLISHLALPEDSEGVSPSDDEGRVIGHVSGSYEGAEVKEPVVEIDFAVDSGGLLTKVFLAAILVFVSASLVICIPPIYSVIADSADSAASLLLGFSAFVLGSLAVPGENKIVSQIYAALRLSSVSLGVALFGYALLFLFNAQIQVAVTYSLAVLLLSSIISILSGFGLIQSWLLKKS